LAFTKLLKPQIQQFIRDNTDQPVKKLALRKNPFPDVTWADILSQITARQKAKSKLPTWFAADNTIYPSRVSVEQTSSEPTAEYKSKLVSGESLIDLTGGFGIDDFYFSKQIPHVTHCELDTELSAIAAHNFKILDAGNIECISGDSLETLRQLNCQWDWIYIDPARRNDAKGKVFMLKDCLPNVPEHLDTYFSYANNILIKTAPILDLTAGLNELKCVKAIHIVALNNEVKELLWILQKDFTGSPTLHAVSITKDGTDTFTTSFEAGAEAEYGLPSSYLYEPNAAIMKSGAFDAVAVNYKLYKLHQHSHLYTGDEAILFPGRRFIIHEVIPYGKADIKKYVEGKTMNVTTRNFPLSVEELRKKWKIKDGGDTYAFFTTNIKNEKIIVLCAKI
jgi:predicted transposase YbfD/YdcC